MQLRSKCVAVMIVVGLAGAAIPPSVGQAPAAGRGTPTRIADDREYLARSMARLALIDLRATPEPDASDYRAAALLLGVAHDLSPDDSEILRRLVESAYNAGMSDKVLEMSRALLGMDPADTVVQLRLISATIAAGAQDAEHRLVEYDKYLSGDKKRFFDDSVRSRLALDAALLCRERGDDAGFIERLTLATQLDATNKEAAALAATLYAQRRPDDQAGRMKMLENLLMADPVDPNVHLTISRELTTEGAYKAASRFHSNAITILRIAGASTDQVELESYMLLWHTLGPEKVVADLNHQVALAKEEAARHRRRLIEAGSPTDRAPNPDDIRLNAAMANVYLIALSVAGNTEAVRATYAELEQQAKASIERMEQAVRRGELDPAQAQAVVSGYKLQFNIMRLWAGLEVDQVLAELEAIKPEDRPDSELFKVLEGWAAFRGGNHDEAIRILTPYAESAELAALGIAAAHEGAGRQAEAIAGYQERLRAAPLELTGAWARSRLIALGRKEDPARVSEAERAADRIPAWVDEMAVRPERFVQVRVRATDNNPQTLDRTRLIVSIENMSPFVSLGLGPDRPISSRFLLIPKLEVLGGGPLNLVAPEVVDLDRRLRLKPRERMEIVVWPDPGQVGWLLEAFCNRSLRIRWRAVQGFQPDQRMGFRPGVMGQSSESDAIVRHPIPESASTLDRLAQAVADQPAPVLPRLAAVVRSLGIQRMLLQKQERTPDAPPMPAPAEILKPIVDAMVARYPRLSVTERATLAATLPHARLTAGMEPFDAVVRADTDPLVLKVVLLTRVTDPEDELLSTCAESDDPVLAELAGLLRERLRRDAKFYSRWTPADVFARPVVPGAEGGARK